MDKNTTTSLNILIVEDEPTIALLERKEMESAGHTTAVSKDGAGALEILSKDKVDVVLLDNQLPDMSGKELLPMIVSLYPKIPVIMVTGHGDEHTAVEILKSGAKDYIVKDYEANYIKSLSRFIENIYRTAQLESVNNALLKTAIKSGKHYHNILHSMVEMVVVVSPDDTIQTVNASALSLLGYEDKELIGQSANMIFPEKRLSLNVTGFNAFSEKSPVINAKTTCIAKDGHKIPVRYSCSVMHDENSRTQGAVYVALDISDSLDAENKLRDAYSDLKVTQNASLNIMEDLEIRQTELDTSLKEKETLLKEVHHRVKNNMQVIISLLKYQADNLKDKNFTLLLKESQNRIKSMSLIHEKLYRSEDLTRINFGDYIKNLVNDLYRFYNINTAKITLKVDTPDISFNIDTAIPCGLIINEFVTNSMKYAFPDNSEGEIKISLHRVSDCRSQNSDYWHSVELPEAASGADGRNPESEMFELILSDNGIGIPEEIDFKNTESLGLNLIFNLTQHQLGGSIELNRDKGTSFRVRFKEPIYRKRM